MFIRWEDSIPWNKKSESVGFVIQIKHVLARCP